MSDLIAEAPGGAGSLTRAEARRLREQAGAQPPAATEAIAAVDSAHAPDDLEFVPIFVPTGARGAARGAAPRGERAKVPASSSSASSLTLTTLAVLALLAAGVVVVLRPVWSWSWVVLAAPLAVALWWRIPRAIFQVRAIDVVFGLAAGLALRLAQGFVEIAVTGSAPFPPALPSGAAAALVDVGVRVVALPLLEEGVFHGILFAALVTAVPIARGRTAAALVALVVSTALYVAFEAAQTVALGAAVGVAPLIAAALVAATCGGMVWSTGRLGAAWITYVVYAATAVALSLVGAS